MRRTGDLFPLVLERGNLLETFCKASRGKRGRPDQRAFEANLDAEIERLRAGLAAGNYPVGRYTRFRIFDPKEREICAASFGERVLHHALMNVCAPEFERRLSEDSFACRKGKGQTGALQRASEWCRRRAWFMKGDIRKCFDSIPHVGLARMLERVFKDREILWWFVRITGTHEREPGKGLPIGNLTSQWLANLYLAPLDRLGGAMVRYMDDCLFFGKDKEELLERRRAAEEVVEGLGLTFKSRMCPMPTRGGVPFLGRRVHGWGAVPDRRSRQRFRRMEEAYAGRLVAGLWSQETYQRHITALVSGQAVVGAG
ncbi:MAG: group II intron reverse transcriptase domain-containing protein [Kiritimatiellae bacterium]|nr:group II intron reverse transcriptase domain-containing protein [Kiritimatiellia bacterium]